MPCDGVLETVPTIDAVGGNENRIDRLFVVQN
jgi:hypothetical protein